MNIPLFPTTLSIPSYDIGKQFGLRTYQHPSYFLMMAALEEGRCTKIYDHYRKLYLVFFLYS
jgi:hypothetical protein